MPHHTGERVSCDCKLHHSSLVAVSTRRTHRRKYGVLEGFVHHSSQHVDDLPLDAEPVDDVRMDENMLGDDILETIGQDWGDEDDEIGVIPTFDEDGSGDEDGEEDDVDEDSLVDEEDFEEDVDEDLLMEDVYPASLDWFSRRMILQRKSVFCNSYQVF